MSVAIEILRSAGLATVQDAGRPGSMHLGLPPGGPLVPWRLARANAAAGNRPGCAGIEVVGSVELVARAPAGARVTVADDGSLVRSVTARRSASRAAPSRASGTSRWRAA